MSSRPSGEDEDGRPDDHWYSDPLLHGRLAMTAPVQELRPESPAEIVAALDLGSGSSLQEIAERVAQIYGKPLIFEGLEEKGWGSLTALWVDQPDQGLIFYRKRDPHVYRAHCIFHEFGHILLGHYWCNAGQQTGMNLWGRDRVYARTLEVLGNAARTNKVEQAAEDIAFLLGRILHRPDSEAARFSAVFG
ncbi:hypothetical protein [Sinomonas terrae]|uniref:IrrE N-terminal-like domain-containing protein n=1 Tax=Sinomonas terrae TaxID=2908838 RepID=A0ABS9U6Y0_9MICC|nr:hypothetical protein [Sinomonas terrae]MCH6472458.1 hypothetical protein [Sinomonas terrae]